MEKKDLRFGVEIEYHDAPHKKVIRQIKKLPIGNEKSIYNKWIYSTEAGITEYNKLNIYGGELSSRILHYNKESFKEIKKVLNILKKYKAKTSEFTALHYHVEADIFNKEQEKLERFLKLYCIYEHVIYKFGYNCLMPRENLSIYAKQAREKLIHYVLNNPSNTYEDLVRKLNKYLGYKIYGVSFFKNIDDERNVKSLNTVEFRMCNASLDEDVVEQEAKFFLELMYFSQNKSHDEFLNHKFDILLKSNLDSYNYSKEYIEDAIELLELLEYPMEDKITFAKQYTRK